MSTSIAEIKKELQALPSQELVNLCLRLAKFKKENKELLNYLLFEAKDEEAFIRSVKEEIETEFYKINTRNFYLAKKTIRKILRTIKKYIRYSGEKKTEIELLIFFCKEIQQIVEVRSHPVLYNLYHNQIKSIRKALQTLHEDLQFDYEEQVKAIEV